MLGRRIIKEFKNDFGTFSVEDLTYNGRRARVLFNAPHHAAQSGLALDNDPRLLFDYNQYLLELSIEVNPRSILILGGGVLTLPMALARRLPKCRITVVEINRDLIKVASDFFGYRDEMGIDIVIDDARTFVAQPGKTYELIITDIFNSFTVPQFFKSQEFASNLANNLSPKGLVATNCISALSGTEAKPVLEISQAYSKSIGPVKVVKADKYYFDTTPQNLLILSGKSANKLLKNLSEAKLWL